jgi:hypothetical protein
MLAVPSVMFVEERVTVRQLAYMGWRKVPPTIVRARIESTVRAMSLNL